MNNKPPQTMLTRSQLIEKLTESNPDLTARDIEEAAKKIFEYMISSLSNGHRIEIRGFGSFSLRTRKEYMARNPKTGKRFSSPRKSVPYFRAGKKLRERVNNSVRSPVDPFGPFVSLGERSESGESTPAQQKPLL